MKYNDNGEYKDIYVKAFDTLPVGAEVDYDGSVVPSGWTEVEDKVSLWTGSSLASPIILSDYPDNYKFFIVKTSANFTAIMPAMLYGSASAGRTAIENSEYKLYQVLFRIEQYDNNTKTINFTPTYVFKNGSFNALANITEVIGVK